VPIRVVRFQHQSQSLARDGDKRILLFDPRMERGVDLLGDRYRRLDIGARNAELVIVRASTPDLIGTVAEGGMLRNLIGATPVRVLAPESPGAAPSLHDVEWSEPLSFEGPSPETLREAEMLCAIQAAGAAYRAPGTHYLLPNGQFHAKSFVRLADALQDYIDLIRLSDWLAYRVDESTALVADNGSLLALLTTIALRVRERLEHAPPIATLNEYPVGPTAIADAVDRFRAQGWQRLLFCVSVNASGRLAREVSALHDVETDVVVLCETHPEPADDFERFAHHPIERWRVNPDGTCSQCPELHLLSIDPRTYEIRPQLRLRPQGPDTHHAAENKEFWEAVERTSAVKLHYDAATAAGAGSPSRHLAVWLDAPQLLEDERFRSLCLEKIRAIDAPDLVVIPHHRASDALTALMREALPNLADDRILSCALGEAAEAAGEHLDGLTHVLLVDDTAVSGTTLVRLHQEVRDLRQEAIPRISAFVVLSRPSTTEDFDHLCRRFTHFDGRGRCPGFHFGHHLLSPGSECPWCRERDFLAERLDGLDGPARAEATKRLGRLAAMLEPPLLWGGGEQLRETFGSIFGELNPEAAFAAVSALAQYMHCRLDADRRDETIKIVDVPLILQAFFDPIIVAGLLRTLPARDLREPASDPALARTLRENARSYPPATIAELALAVTEGKLPAAPVRELLQEHEGDWVEALKALLAGY